jgi:hypothetical protein
MGFYDYRCLASGVSLKGQPTAFVILEQGGDTFVPCSVPVVGAYDRLGAIDNVIADENSARLLRAFQATTAQIARIDWEAIDLEPLPLSRFDDLARAFDRALIDGVSAIECDGTVLSYSLLHRDVLQTIVSDAVATDADDTTTLLQRVIGTAAFPTRVYGAAAAANDVILRRELAELLQLNTWLAVHGIPWAPPSDPEQHFGSDTERFVREAEQRFANDPRLVATLATLR